MKVTIHPALIALLPLCIGVPCTLAGCGSGGGTKSVVSPDPTTISLEKLRSAPAQVTVGAKTLTLSATIIRNFMPQVGATTGPLLEGAITIGTSDGSAIPSGLKIVSAYAYQGSTSGSFGTLTAVGSDDASGGMRANVANGPALTGINSASVVVLFQDATGAQYLVQAPSVNIINAD